MTKLSTSFRCTALALFAATVVALAGASTASACGFDCRNSPTGYRAVDSRIEITFTTSVPVRAGGYVNPNASFNGPFHPLQPATQNYTTTHTLTTAAGLQPNTLYWDFLTFEDAQGRRWQTSISRSGMRTLHRRVTVRFQSIHVIDDSDNWGAGELTFHFKVGSVTRPFAINNASWSTGSNNPINVELSTVDSPDSTVVSVQGYDDDAVGFCRRGLAPDWSWGQHECGQWGTANATLNLRGHYWGNALLPAMWTSFMPQFAVYGSYTVSYFA